jgi:LysR family transcriptional regulator, glycine cleavage system transcriptional activator
MAVAKRMSRRSVAKSANGFRRLPLGSLRVFVAAAEHLSFTQAAQVLGVTTGAVSMQIRALEEYLRTPLFRRRGRLIELTADGEGLLPRVRNGLEELERAIDEARLDRRSGPLTITLLSSFLQQWLLPRLPDFQKRFPAIDLRVHASASLVDFLHSDVQAAIRFGQGDWPQLHVEKILDDWLVPICTPQLLEKHGPIATRDDLRRHRLLHSVGEPWRCWIEETAVAEEWAPSGASFDDSIAVLRLAEAGQGLALARWSLAAREVAAGRVVIASRKIIRTNRGYYFVCPSAYLNTDKVVAFREWVMQQAQSAPKPPGA